MEAEIRAAEQRVAKNKRVVAQYEADCAPLVAAYDRAAQGLKDTYAKSAAGHAKGIEVLKASFSYTPLFIREQKGQRYSGKKDGMVATDEVFHANTFRPKSFL